MNQDYQQQFYKTITSVEKLPEDCLKALSELGREKKYKHNEYFARESDHPVDLAFICNGTFRAFYRDETGQEYNKTFFTENTFMVALTAIISYQPNHINIQALEESTVLLFNYEQFTKLYDTFHPLERMARRVIEFEWAKKEIREIRLVMSDAAKRYDFFCLEHPGLVNNIPLYHIASYLGITPIHLSRIRAKKIQK